MTDFTFTSEPRTDDEYRAAIDMAIAEMRLLHEQSVIDQRDIDRIRREARQIHDQTSRIMARTQARLDALEEMVPVGCGSSF